MSPVDADEYERQIAELECRRAELREAVVREQDALDALIEASDDWHHAKSIRTYVAAVRSWAKREGVLPAHVEWIAWAHDQADRIDPLRPSPPSVLDSPSDDFRELGWYEILNEDGSIERIWG